MSERVEIDHVQWHYDCHFCNRRKGPNLSGLERVGSRRKLVALFNPRRHKWSRHFRWDGPYLIGKTQSGE